MNEPLQSSYDCIAEDYAAHFQHELDQKPFDRKMLDRLVEQASHLGMICDMGCGPGQIARYLRDRGAAVGGIDLSPVMVQQARRFNPDLVFQSGDMLALTDIANHAYGGIAAFYSIIHIPRSHVVQALREFKRVLCPQGLLLLTFHIGQETRHLSEWWGKPVSLDFHFFETEAMKRDLTTAGFEVQEAIERDPYPAIEVQTRRAYLFAKRP